MNAHGPHAVAVHQVLQQGQIGMPYIVSEMTSGKWFQVPQTTWGDWMEDSPQGKLQYLLAGYAAAVNASSLCALAAAALPLLSRSLLLSQTLSCCVRQGGMRQLGLLRALTPNPIASPPRRPLLER